MYKISKTSFGYRLTFEGYMRLDEMRAWVDESKKILLTQTTDFGVLVDMTELKVLPPDSQAKMREGQQLYKSKGMKRSAVLVESAIVKMQFVRIAKESGIYDWERYFDAGQSRDFEQQAMKWIVDGIDPDL